MLLKNRSLLVKLVKSPQDKEAEKEPLDLSSMLHDVEHVRDMVIETAATVAVIAAGYKVVDTLCKIAVNLSARGLIR